MDKGVYVYDCKEDNLRQITFIEVRTIGLTHGRVEYAVKKIAFTLIDPESIFPAFRRCKYSEEEIFNFSPLLISSDSKMNTFTEGGPMYNFHIKNYVPCNLSFRFIEHLYENFKSIQDTFKNITENINSNNQ